jgi:hypothetical protein
MPVALNLTMAASRGPSCCVDVARANRTGRSAPGSVPAGWVDFGQAAKSAGVDSAAKASLRFCGSLVVRSW